MKKLESLLKEQMLTLIVSLPKNDPELAKAAIAGGADALKVHIRVHHDASGTQFGPLKKEKKALKAILEIAGERPVGIVPGSTINPPQEAEIKELAEMGFDFVDLYAKAFPNWLWQDPVLSKMAALQEAFQVGQVNEFATKGANIFEAAIVPVSGYGKRMNIGDLQNYLAIASSAQIPVVVPTQREIRADELPALWDTGIKGLIIGAIVTGQTAESIERATRSFAQAQNTLKETVKETT